jgi:UDP-glucose 4-epimerase
METVWITGGQGFIGSHLVRFVSSCGNRVFGIGHGHWPAEEAGRWGYDGWCNGGIEAANLSQLEKISGPPDTVYHLAGGSSVGASLQNPREDFCRTVESTSCLLEWMRFSAPNARMVSVSSAAVYGAVHDRPIPEDAEISPCSPYGYHKAMMENLCRSYGENYGVRGAIVRLFSAYGPGLKKQLIWELCCRLATAGNKPVMLGGTGGELRDWLHVSDAIHLLWLARMQCADNCPAINGGTGLAASVREIANGVCRAWGEVPDAEFNGIARKGDPPSLVADCSMSARLGFKPGISLPEGIQGVVEWFKSRK